MRVATDHIDEVPAIAPEPRGPRLGGTDVFRGSLVIITALVIGGFVISRGLDETSNRDTTAEETAAETIDDESATSTDSTAPVDQTTSTTAVVTSAAVDETAETTTEVAPEGPVVRAPSEVKVLVLNGAQTQGIAGRGTEVLKAASYLTGAPKNASSQRPTAIYYIDGYQAEALAVAAVFGPGLETLVQPLDPADVPIDDTQESHVIVVIGADQLLPIS